MSLDEQREDAERWLQYARSDLLLAEDLVSTGRHAPHLCCYHAQQAVEKALKAGLIWSGVEPPRGHDLDTLRVLLPQTWMLHNRHPNLGTLTEWCVEARYLGDWPEVTDVGAQDAAQAGAPPGRRSWLTLTSMGWM